VKPAGLEKTKKERFVDEIPSFHRMIALSRRTADEAVRESAAAVFAALDPIQQRRLAAIQPVHDSCQQQLLEQHLLRLAICPQSSEVLDGAVGFAHGAFHHYAVSEIKFVIGGLKQSGKTTLLYLLASVLCRKLQLSDEASSVLFFPFNWELSSLEIEEPARLLRLFIQNAFDALEYSSLRLLPFLGPLRKWFWAIIFGASISAPQELAGCPDISVAAVQKLAKDLRDAQDRDGDDSLGEFVREVCAFPRRFAKAVGLHGVVFIFDGFESTNLLFRPHEGFFARSLRDVRLCDVLSAELEKAPYLVSMRDEVLFFESFLCTDAQYIGTEGLVQDGDGDEVWVRDPNPDEDPALRLAEADCLGHPGYVAAFRKIVSRVRAIEENAPPSPWAVIRTAGDVSRYKTVKYELLNLVALLIDAGVKGLETGHLEKIRNAPGLALKVVTAKERHEGQPPRKRGLQPSVSGLAITKE
jgi:hypothetical protein